MEGLNSAGMRAGIFEREGQADEAEDASEGPPLYAGPRYDAAPDADYGEQLVRPSAGGARSSTSVCCLQLLHLLSERLLSASAG